MAAVSSSILIVVQLCSAVAIPVDLTKDSNNVEARNHAKWVNVQFARLETKIAFEETNQTIEAIPVESRVLNDTAADCDDNDTCPCQKGQDCSPDAICTNDRSQASGYRCRCKTGFIDVFYTEPQLPGRLCVKTLPLNDRQETDRTADVTSSRFLNFNTIVESNRPLFTNGDSFPSPPAFPAPLGQSLSQPQLRAVFDDVDQDKDESISLRELKNYVHRLGEDGAFMNLTDADTSRMIQLADRNGNNGVEWNEFIRLFSQQKFLRVWVKKRVYS